MTTRIPLVNNGGALSELPTTDSLSGNISGCIGVPYTSFKNVLINGGFTVNQRKYVSAVALAAGVYGHDRWKAGSGGGTYSFTQLATNTQITIASSKTLIQVIEDKNVFGTSYTLSWTGTAQARYAVNSVTPAGSYASSPISITGQTVGTTMSIEFNAGTLGNPQLELGGIVTIFDVRDYTNELLKCQRYYWRTGPSPGLYSLAFYGFYGIASAPFGISINHPVNMRASPTATLVGTFTLNNCAAPTVLETNAQSFFIYSTITALGPASFYSNNSGEFTFSAEL